MSEHPFAKAFGAVQWPEEIAHLKGVVLVRKRDGNSYRIERPSGQSFGGKPAAYLAPVGCAWDSRSHWKTYEKILSEMRVEVMP